MGPNPVNRGRPGSKMHIRSDANGLPLLVGVPAGNTHDSEGHSPWSRVTQRDTSRTGVVASNPR